MNVLAVVVFVATYVGMAFGRIPGLRLDRTGIALVAVAVLLAAGAGDPATIGSTVHLPTLVLLFALMILSAQFAVAGFYGACAGAITRSLASPARLLALTVATGGLLSAILANDVVVYAMTPLLCLGIQRRGLDPRPYLLGLAGASNAGSAATLIGNPQNILIGQVGQLDFWQYLAVAAAPAAAALVIVYLAVRIAWRTELGQQGSTAMLPEVTVDRRQVAKGIAATAVLVALFATPVPREVAALAVAALLLTSRSLSSRAVLRDVDWPLLLLFACLFVVTGTFAATGIAAGAVASLAHRDLLPESVAVLAPLALAASNTIGNVPAVMLLLAVWPEPGTEALYGLAILSTLAGNLLLVGSLANIIVAERAAQAGVILSFADFARAGIPATVLSMAVAALWLGLGGWLPWR